MNNLTAPHAPYWRELVTGSPVSRITCPLIGVLPGEGIGREVIEASLRVLDAVASAQDLKFDVRWGGSIGLDAERTSGKPLTDEVSAFCREVFQAGGAILAGPGGGRFVYDLRREFDLFCKFSPLEVWPELENAGRLRREAVHQTDIIIVRENTGGIYQGVWDRGADSRGALARHSFAYSEYEVRRIARVAAALASRRRANLVVTIKDGGIPSISDLWRRYVTAEAEAFGIDPVFLGIDYAAYRLIQDAPTLDVILTPNLFGDVLADVGAVLLGSRGLSWSANFNPAGAAVYQTNHGAAYDLARTGTANPIGQILSLAAMLRESFGLSNEAAEIVRGVRSVLGSGVRTADLTTKSPVGTSEITQEIINAVSAVPSRT